MNSTQFFQHFTSILSAFAAMVVALAPVFVIVLPFLLPVISGWIKNEKLKQAFQLLASAGLQAITASAKAYSAAMVAARLPDSDGGTTVTEAEAKSATMVGVEAGIAWLKQQGVFAKVVDALGGEEKARDALIAIIQNRLNGHESAVAPKPPQVVTATLDAIQGVNGAASGASVTVAAP